MNHAGRHITDCATEDPPYETGWRMPCGTTSDPECEATRAGVSESSVVSLPIVAVVWNLWRMPSELRTGNEQEPNARRDYIAHVVSRQNHLSALLKEGTPRRMLVRSTWFCGFDPRLAVGASWLRDSDRFCCRDLRRGTHSQFSIFNPATGLKSLSDVSKIKS